MIIIKIIFSSLIKYLKNIDIIILFKYYLITIDIFFILSIIFLINNFYFNVKIKKEIKKYINSSHLSKTSLEIYYENLLNNIESIVNNPIKFDYQINQINNIKDKNNYNEILKNLKKIKYEKIKVYINIKNKLIDLNYNEDKIIKIVIKLILLNL